MEISIKDFDPQENKEQARPKKPRKRIDPTFGVIIRILICFALIDIPIWSYFHFVKGVSVWEGLQQMRNEVQAKANPPRTEPIQFALIDPQKPAKPT
jgi:hypothetical protein